MFISLVTMFDMSRRCFNAVLVGLYTMLLFPDFIGCFTPVAGVGVGLGTEMVDGFW